MRRAVPGSINPVPVFAISDLHVAAPENRDIVSRLRPESADDWLIVAGDVAERVSDVEWALSTLRERYAKVIWAPGNHELWTVSSDPVQLRGVDRYEHLVSLCRSLDVLTPEDPYAVYAGRVAIAPLFLLYDYTFRPAGLTQAQALEQAYSAGIVCRDEFVLHPDPYPSREAWCQARVKSTEARLSALDSSLRTVLVNHFPMVVEPTKVLRYPEFSIWCGTAQTADWHIRFRAETVVYGHLHIPRTLHADGVVFEEVSLGYPREWQARSRPAGVPKLILA